MRKALKALSKVTVIAAAALLSFPATAFAATGLERASKALFGSVSPADKFIGMFRWHGGYGLFSNLGYGPGDLISGMLGKLSSVLWGFVHLIESVCFPVVTTLLSFNFVDQISGLIGRYEETPFGPDPENANFIDALSNNMAIAIVGSGFLAAVGAYATYNAVKAFTKGGFKKSMVIGPLFWGAAVMILAGATPLGRFSPTRVLGGSMATVSMAAQDVVSGFVDVIGLTPEGGQQSTEATVGSSKMYNAQDEFFCARYEAGIQRAYGSPDEDAAHFKSSTLEMMSGIWSETIGPQWSAAQFGQENNPRWCLMLDMNSGRNPYEIATLYSYALAGNYNTDGVAQNPPYISPFAVDNVLKGKPREQQLLALQLCAYNIDTGLFEIRPGAFAYWSSGISDIDCELFHKQEPSESGASDGAYNRYSDLETFYANSDPSADGFKVLEDVNPAYIKRGGLLDRCYNDVGDIREDARGAETGVIPRITAAITGTGTFSLGNNAATCYTAVNYNSSSSDGGLEDSLIHQLLFNTKDGWSKSVDDAFEKGQAILESGDSGRKDLCYVTAACWRTYSTTGAGGEEGYLAPADQFTAQEDSRNLVTSMWGHNANQRMFTGFVALIAALVYIVVFLIVGLAIASSTVLALIVYAFCPLYAVAKVAGADKDLKIAKAAVFLPLAQVVYPLLLAVLVAMTTIMNNLLFAMGSVPALLTAFTPLISLLLLNKLLKKAGLPPLTVKGSVSAVAGTAMAMAGDSGGAARIGKSVSDSARGASQSLSKKATSLRTTARTTAEVVRAPMGAAELVKDRASLNHLKRRSLTTTAKTQAPSIAEKGRAVKAELEALRDDDDRHKAQTKTLKADVYTTRQPSTDVTRSEAAALNDAGVASKTLAINKALYGSDAAVAKTTSAANLVGAERKAGRLTDDVLLEAGARQAGTPSSNMLVARDTEGPTKGKITIGAIQRPNLLSAEGRSMKGMAAVSETASFKAAETMLGDLHSEIDKDIERLEATYPADVAAAVEAAEQKEAARIAKGYADLDSQVDAAKADVFASESATRTKLDGLTHQRNQLHASAAKSIAAAGAAATRKGRATHEKKVADLHVAKDASVLRVNEAFTAATGGAEVKGAISESGVRAGLVAEVDIKHLQAHAGNDAVADAVSTNLAAAVAAQQADRKRILGEDGRRVQTQLRPKEANLVLPTKGLSSADMKRNRTRGK